MFGRSLTATNCLGDAETFSLAGFAGFLRVAFVITSRSSQPGVGCPYGLRVDRADRATTHASRGAARVGATLEGDHPISGLIRLRVHNRSILISRSLQRTRLRTTAFKREATIA